MIWIPVLVAAMSILALGAAGAMLWRKRASRTSSRGANAETFSGATVKFPDFQVPAPDSGRRAGAGLQGTLAQTPLHDILQYLSLGRKSGILELVSGRRAGRVVLQEGSVCKNSYRGKEGMEAMFMMMDLPEGDFEFYEQAIEEPHSQARLEVVDLIMLWMDRKPKKKA